MSRLQMLADIPVNGWTVLAQERAAPLMRYGLIERMPGFGFSYRLTRAGRAFVEMVRRVRA